MELVTLNQIARHAEKIYSHLTSAWYNWAVSYIMHEKSLHIWSLNSAYHSMLYLSRLLTNIANLKPEDEKILNSMPINDFIKFLKSEVTAPEMVKLRSNCLAGLVMGLERKLVFKEVDSFFSWLGDCLDIYRTSQTLTSSKFLFTIYQVDKDISKPPLAKELKEASTRANHHLVVINNKINHLLALFIKGLSAEQRPYYNKYLTKKINLLKVLLKKEGLLTNLGKIQPQDLERNMEYLEKLINSFADGETPDWQVFYSTATEKYVPNEELETYSKQLIDSVNNIKCPQTFLTDMEKNILKLFFKADKKIYSLKEIIKEVNVEVEEVKSTVWQLFALQLLVQHFSTSHLTWDDPDNNYVLNPLLTAINEEIKQLLS